MTTDVTGLSMGTRRVIVWGSALLVLAVAAGLIRGRN